jgi:uncharacterized protein
MQTRLDEVLSQARHTSRAAGRSDFLWTTYRWMSLGLGLTGLVALLVASSEQMLGLIFGTPMLFWGLLIGEVVLVISFMRVAERASATTAALMFLGYSALNGLTLSAIFVAYTQASIASTFFVTAGAFGALSIYGATTQRDLSPVGRFMFIGLVGLVIASVVNIFMHSEAITWITTYAGVLIFAGLTAYDTQRLQQLYMTSGGAGNLALRGALILYLDFINLFLFLLRLFGQRRD